MTQFGKKAVTVSLRGKEYTREVELSVDSKVVTGFVGKVRIKWDTKKYPMPSVYFMGKKQPKGDDLKQAKEDILAFLNAYKIMCAIENRTQREVAASAAPSTSATQTKSRKQYVPGAFNISVKGGKRQVNGEIYKNILGIYHHTTGYNVVQIATGIGLCTAADTIEARKFVKALEKLNIDWLNVVSKDDVEVVRKALIDMGALVANKETVTPQTPVVGATLTNEVEIYND